MRPTLIETKKQRFLIMEAPTDRTLPDYIKIFKKLQVRHVVRTCSPTYKIAPLSREGIRFTDLPFPEGDPPCDSIIKKWLKILTREFLKEDAVVAVHCVSGLDRAPVLVAAALIEDGMDPPNAISLIRKKRPSAITSKQIKFLEEYNSKKDEDCIIL